MLEAYNCYVSLINSLSYISIKCLLKKFKIFIINDQYDNLSDISKFKKITDKTFLTIFFYYISYENK